MKKWQKIFIVVCGIGFLCSIFLLIPSVYETILLTLEKSILRHPLERGKWIYRITGTGAILCITFIVLIGIVIFSLSEKHIIKNVKTHKNIALSKIFKNLWSGIPLLYFFLLVIGFILVCFAYTLPTERMQNNVKLSVSYFEVYVEHGSLHTMETEESGMDDTTDAHMLIISAQKNSKHFIKAALLNEYPNFNGEYADKSLVEFYENGNKNYNIISYGRYWHGYTIFLKPLLLFTTYGGIRHIMMYCQIILVIFIITLLINKKQKKYIVPFIGVWLFFNPVSLCLSMQYNTIFILLLVELLVIIIFDDKYFSSKRLWIYHFFIVGCLTCYFDFLTYPLVTFGIPIAFLLSMYGSDNFKDNFILLIKCSIVWTLGYIMMWAGKWFIGSMISGTNILTNAKAAIVNRTSSTTDSESFNCFTVIIRNLKTGYNFFITLIIAFAIFISNLCKKRKVDKKNYILIVTSIMPFVWYCVVKNHSFIHYWFTYRILGISVFSLLLFTTSMKKQSE